MASKDPAGSLLAAVILAALASTFLLAPLSFGVGLFVWGFLKGLGLSIIVFFAGFIILTVAGYLGFEWAEKQTERNKNEVPTLRSQRD